MIVTQALKEGACQYFIDSNREAKNEVPSAGGMAWRIILPSASARIPADANGKILTSVRSEWTGSAWTSPRRSKSRSRTD